MRQINNAMYDTLGHTWWSSSAGFEISSLRYCVNPLRFGYFKDCLAGYPLPRQSVLDIGCGGGFLSEEFAKAGFEVDGIDPSNNSVQAAREHADGVGLPVRYHVGKGELLPFPDGHFGVVACCDVLEHVDDVARVIQEASRTLSPGGAFLFDTVNRTFRSWLTLIKIWQDWGFMGFEAPNAHVWSKFIKPRELTTILQTNGMVLKDLKGIGPRGSPLAMLCASRQIRTGKLIGEAVADVFALRQTADLGLSYMGWAVKQQ